MRRFAAASCCRSLHCSPSIERNKRVGHIPSPWRGAALRLSLSTKADPSKIRSLPTRYLRAMDASNFDSVTLQRTDVPFDATTGKPLHRTFEDLEIMNCSFDREHYRVTWSDGLISMYSATWVEEALQKWKGGPKLDRVLWSGLTEEIVRSSPMLSMSFEHAISEEGMKVSLRSLFEYGIMIVTNTPIHDGGAGVAVLASSLGGGSIKNSTSLWTNYWKGGHNEIVLPRGTDGPMRTLYGTIWSTTSSGQAAGSSVADSAYGHEGLPLHTDMTYHRDPPGLQIFTMVQPAISGGESVFGDGFASAERLRRANPEAFAVLSTVNRRYRCVDHATGWHLEASGPVITDNNGEVVMIRHNDLDRLPDLPPAECRDDVDSFYAKVHAAHLAWDQILAEDNMRLVIGLQPGDTIVVANQVSLLLRC